MIFRDLGDGDATLACQLLLGLLRGVGVGEVRVEILVQNFRSLLAEVPPFPPRIKEPRSENHHRLASALLQLDLGERIRQTVNGNCSQN